MNRTGCDFTLVRRHIEGIPELDVPGFRMANGGTCIRGGDGLPEPTATALPAQISSAATFDRPLKQAVGRGARPRAPRLGAPGALGTGPEPVVRVRR